MYQSQLTLKIIWTLKGTGYKLSDIDCLIRNFGSFGLKKMTVANDSEGQIQTVASIAHATVYPFKKSIYMYITYFSNFIDLCFLMLLLLFFPNLNQFLSAVLHLLHSYLNQFLSSASKPIWLLFSVFKTSEISWVNVYLMLQCIYPQPYRHSSRRS